VQAHEAFTRVVQAEEGAYLEGKAPLQRKLVAKLGRMLCEADAAAGSTSSSALHEVMINYIGITFIAVGVLLVHAGHSAVLCSNTACSGAAFGDCVRRYCTVAL
jgi:hypothetical protein